LVKTSQNVLKLRISEILAFFLLLILFYFVAPLISCIHTGKELKAKREAAKAGWIA
jgi:hypothetical protein